MAHDADGGAPPSIPPKQTFDYRTRDARRWAMLEKLFADQGMGFEQVLRDFPAFIRRRELPRFLAHAKLFEQVVDLPGCVVELGVFKGSSLMTWANLMETFCPGDRFRMVYGFDHFGGLTDFAEEDGRQHDDRNQGKVEGGWKAPADIARTLVKLFNEDTLVPNIPRVELVEGDVFETLPRFLKDHPGLKISLLHLDVDLYKPTKYAFDMLYPLVVEGGVVILDEYGLVPWQGETKAIDEFFAGRDDRPVIRKFPYSATPSGYFVKGQR